MSRKNIYQIIAEQKIDPTNAFERLKYYLFTKQYYGTDFRMRTVSKFIDEYAFPHMPIRKAYISLVDLIGGAGIIRVREKYEREIEKIH